MSTTATGFSSLLRAMVGAARRTSIGLDQARKPRWHVLFERGATPREARIGHEIILCAERLLTLTYPDSLRASIRSDAPALHIILEVRDHDLVEDLLVHRRVLDRHHGLHAPVEIARHHVGRADIDRSVAARQAVTGAEAIDTRMLKETPDDALNVDRLGEMRHTGTQAADAAHHEIDL